MQLKLSRWTVVLALLLVFAWAHTHRYEVIRDDSVIVSVWDRWRHRACFHLPGKTYSDGSGKPDAFICLKR